VASRWLIEDKGVLQRNPARGVVLPPQPLPAPRQLTPDQRYVLRTLVERDGTLDCKLFLNRWDDLLRVAASLPNRRSKKRSNWSGLIQATSVQYAAIRWACGSGWGWHRH
jgi:hypothetical protein